MGDYQHDQSSPSHVDRLTDEVLARIIRLLPWRERLVSAEQVSRRWRRVALEAGWSDFTAFGNQPWNDEHNIGLKKMSSKVFH